MTGLTAPSRVCPRTARLTGLLRFPVRGPEHPARQVLRRYVTAAGQRQPAQLRDQAVGLAGDHVVHPREAPVRGLAHDGLAVGAAEHGDDAGIELTHPAQQGQRRHVLLER